MDDLALELQVSRIINAVESTTIFTTIFPNPTAKADYTTTQEAPVVTVTQEANQNDAEGLPGGKIFGALEIIIALGALGMLNLTVLGKQKLILCQLVFYYSSWESSSAIDEENPRSESEHPHEFTRE